MSHLYIRLHRPYLYIRLHRSEIEGIPTDLASRSGDSEDCPLLLLGPVAFSHCLARTAKRAGPGWRLNLDQPQSRRAISSVPRLRGFWPLAGEGCNLPSCIELLLGLEARSTSTLETACMLERGQAVEGSSRQRHGS